MPRPVLMAALLALAAGAVAPARGDVVHLTSGGAVRGDVVSETRAEVVVRTPSGTAVIPRREVESIEREAGTPAIDALADEYRARLRAIDARDPEARYALGLWLKARGAAGLARREFEAAVGLDPDHRFAREELDAPAGRGRVAPGATPAHLALAARPEVAAALEALRGRARSDDLRAAWAALDALDATERPALAAALRELARDLRRDHLRLERRTRELTGGGHDPDAARALALERWTQARDTALAALAADAAPTSTGVAERVAEARAAWLAVDALQRRDLHGLLTLAPDDALRLRDDLLAAERRLGDVLEGCAARSLDVPLERPAVDPASVALLTARGGGRLHDALEGWEGALVRRLRDEQVLAANAARVRTADPARRPSADELEQVRLTNEHRVALGRPALRLDLDLAPTVAASAVAASADDVVLGAAPVDGALAAAPAAIGAELRADGLESARAALDLWLASPPHHRALLDPTWTTLGVRRDGARWGVCFGAAE